MKGRDHWWVLCAVVMTVVLTFALVSEAADSVTDFEDVVTSSTSPPVTLTNPYGPFNWMKWEDGWDPARVVNGTWYHDTYGCSASFPSGNNALWGEGPLEYSEVTITHASGGSFDFIGAKFASSCISVGGDPFGASTITITGHQAGGGTVNDTFGVGTSWTTRSYTSMTGLTSLTIRGDGANKRRMFLMDDFSYALALPVDIFDDGFESGNLNNWSSHAP